MAGDHQTSHILQSLFANLAITVAKGVAAALTGSGALLAETLHTAADCGNQLLLLLGVRRAARPPSATHPLGHGRLVYFWSFMVALLLFTGGGAFSVYEGVHKLGQPEPVGDLRIGFVILGISLALEGWSLLGNVRELHRRRGDTGFWRHLGATKDSDLVVVFGENAAAVVGLVLAGAALAVADLTGDGRWDAIGTIAIGVVLIAVALFLAVEIQSLLIGEAADPSVEREARAAAAEDPRMVEVLRCLTVQQGPGEVMVALKVRFRSELQADEVARAINEFERRLHQRVPALRWSFVEPDLED